MNEMVERVRRRFAEMHLEGCETLVGGGSIEACVGTCPCRDFARVAVEAMREPTESMKRCGINYGWSGTIDGLSNDEMDAAGELWIRMISEALEE